MVNPPAKLVTLTRHGDWYQVRLQDGRIGWIAGFLVVDPTSGTEGGRGSGAAPKRAPGEIDDPGKGTPADRWVLGYYTEDYPGDPTSHGSLARGQQVLDSMAAFLHPVDASGRVSGKASRRAMETSRSTGIRALALVHNLTASGFDAKRAHALLQTANSRAQAAADILDILEEGGYDGVNIDLENVYAQDRSKLTAFMTELAEKLRPRGYLVTMSVPAKTADHAGAGWVGAFDYYALGRVCDRVMLMTYDEHSKTSGPGPIASYNWVEKVVRYATTQMPRAKILLGIPAYGYDWNLDTGRVVALPYTQVMNRAKNLGIDPSWDPEARSPHFKYVDSRGERHEIWFESSESIKPKLDLIDKYGLGGVAIWKLGYEDDAYWKAIREKLR
jgi:spore germination protein YaaH